MMGAHYEAGYAGFYSGQGLSGLVDWGFKERRYQGDAPDDRNPADSR